jgi:hypothetical protein
MTGKAYGDAKCLNAVAWVVVSRSASTGQAKPKKIRKLSLAKVRLLTMFAD